MKINPPNNLHFTYGEPLLPDEDDLWVDPITFFAKQYQNGTWVDLGTSVSILLGDSDQEDQMQDAQAAYDRAMKGI